MVDGVIRIIIPSTKPNIYFLRCFVDLPHDRDLMIAFPRITLVDADSVNPHPHSWMISRHRLEE
jgi:hypothetical protein